MVKHDRALAVGVCQCQTQSKTLLRAFCRVSLAVHEEEESQYGK